MTREEIVDIRGMAQVIALLEHCGDKASRRPSSRTSSCSLTAPVTTTARITRALREALYRTDRRIGALIEMFRARGLLESTLFVVTSDHGMASQRVELKANPLRGPQRAGIQGVFAEPMIYLRDLRVEIERARDLRSLAVTVFDNDATARRRASPNCRRPSNSLRPRQRGTRRKPHIRKRPRSIRNARRRL